MKALCASSLWLIGGLWFAAAMSLPLTATAQERLLNISVHVQGDKRHNRNREPALQNAPVFLENQRTGQVFSGRTDANGRCLFPQVPLGPYLIKAQYKRVSGLQNTQTAVSVVRFYLPIKR